MHYKCTMSVVSTAKNYYRLCSLAGRSAASSCNISAAQQYHDHQQQTGRATDDNLDIPCAILFRNWKHFEYFMPQYLLSPP